LAKNFKSLDFYKQRLIGAVVSTSAKSRGRSKALRELALDPEFFGEFENLSRKKGSQEKS